MNILDKIVVHKLREVNANQKELSIQDLEESEFFRRDCISMSKALKAKKASGIIAEIKRRSPSKGDIHVNPEVDKIAKGYVQAGASAISVLTDAHFFGGGGEDLVSIRRFCDVPILRKDFVVDEYQITEAKAMGADAILLIAAVLTPYEVMRFASIADALGMESLLEVHNQQELKASLSLNPMVKMIGVNNRNLKDFSVDIENSLALASLIPRKYVKVAESGINDPAKVQRLSDAGFKGFLIGEHFMKEAQPGAACARFIKEVETLKSQPAS